MGLRSGTGEGGLPDEERQGGDEQDEAPTYPAGRRADRRQAGDYKISGEDRGRNVDGRGDIPGEVSVLTRSLPCLIDLATTIVIAFLRR